MVFIHGFWAKENWSKLPVDFPSRWWAVALTAILFALSAEFFPSAARFYTDPGNAHIIKRRKAAQAPFQNQEAADLDLAEGIAIISPAIATAGTYGTWHVIYTVGTDGMEADGGIKTQFPNGWHLNRPLQTDHPDRANYVSASASRTGVTLHTTVLTGEGLDGQRDRHDRVVKVVVDGQGLLPGDVITITYGDTSGGGEGIRAPTTTGVDEVLIACDTNGDGVYRFLDNYPRIVVGSKLPSRLTVIIPSQIQAGLPITINVVATDQYWNPAQSFTGTIDFSCSDPQATLPSAYTFRGPTDGGYRWFSVTLHTSGTQVITITESQLAPGGVRSNPTVVGHESPQLFLYWGDLHSHSEFSFDGAGHPG